MSNNFTENDWRLFKSKVPDWQEKYIEKLNNEYLNILQSDVLPSEKFWELEKRINNDKNHSGIIVSMKRSNLTENIIALINEGVIGYNDILDFSEALKNTVKFFVEGQK